MREIFVFAFALAVFGASGQAGAFEVKDQIPDSLTWNGVTIFGTIDIGYAYQNHGAKFDSTFPQTLEYNIWGAKNASKQIWSFDASALERTGAGVKTEKSLGGGWVAVGMSDTSFNPLSGNLANGPASLLRNSGVPLADQTANGDSNRAGQLFNGQAYGGISNPSYGTLTAGRQQTLQYDQLLEYGPRERSYGFGVRGYSAGFSGSGDSEAAAGIIRSDTFIDTGWFMPLLNMPVAARIPDSSEMPTSSTRAAPIAVSRPMPSISGWTLLFRLPPLPAHL